MWFFPLLLARATGWWDTGHILVGEIAARQLNQTQASKLAALLNLNVGYYPGSEFPYACTWMDEIRSSTDAFAPWHYVNRPFCNNSLPQANCTVLYPPPSVTLLTQLSMLSDTLGVHSTKYGDAWNKAFAIRMFIHMVGDLHQPFHNVGMFSTRFPTGDLGGNLFYLFYNASGTVLRNAHSLFDSVGGLYTSFKPSPLTAEYEHFIRNEASSLIEAFPAANFSDLYPNISEKSASFFDRWSLEGFNMAVERGYNMLTYNGRLNDTYIEMLRYYLRERIVLGGYRLGYLLSQANLTLQGPIPEFAGSPAARDPWPTSSVVLTALGILALVVLAFLAGMCVQRRRTHSRITPLALEE